MSKTKNKITHLIVAASENDPDMLYAFVIPSEVACRAVALCEGLEESLIEKETHPSNRAAT
jgi:hypothetical protein